MLYSLKMVLQLCQSRNGQTKHDHLTFNCIILKGKISQRTPFHAFYLVESEYVLVFPTGLVKLWCCRFCVLKYSAVFVPFILTLK